MPIDRTAPEVPLQIGGRRRSTRQRGGQGHAWLVMGEVPRPENARSKALAVT
jgi:hypothetical protein